MATGPDYRTVSRTDTVATGIDAGLRQYMLRVYNYMAGGVAITGLVAYFFSNMLASNEQLFYAVYGSPLKWVIIFAPVAFAFFFGMRIHAMAAATAQILFWAFSVLMGLSLAWIFLAYTGESIARVFFISAGMFGAMSLYGYTTKRDLTSWGSFLFMGVIGLLLAMIVNLFLQSSALGFAISVIGVLVFTGLTAYDTQKIKEMYSEYDEAGTMTKKAILGAFNLYLDFINLFIMLLRLMGVARSE
ncbi:MAG TPA: Bax inhibitor-1/YccA family protein [Dongiaceae bacterium]|jgi:FtsH-binding integral membrane protein